MACRDSRYVRHLYGGAGHHRRECSLPHIAGSLSASIDEATWVLTSYLVANAIILPITGWLLSRLRAKESAHGIRRGVHGVLFSLRYSRPRCRCWCFSVSCRAPRADACSRFLQAVLLEAFPADQRGKAMGFWGLGIVVAPVMGPGSRWLAY